MQIGAMLVNQGYLQHNTDMMKDSVLTNMRMNQSGQEVLRQTTQANYQTENNFTSAIMDSKAVDVAQRLGTSVDVFA